MVVIPNNQGPFLMHPYVPWKVGSRVRIPINYLHRWRNPDDRLSFFLSFSILNLGAFRTEPLLPRKKSAHPTDGDYEQRDQRSDDQRSTHATHALLRSDVKK